MKEMLERIKSDRIFNKFLSEIRIIDIRTLPIQYYIGDSLIIIFRKKTKVLQIFIDDIDDFTHLTYNKHQHNMLINFVNIEFNSFILRNLDKDIDYCNNIEEYEELITKDKI